MPAIYAHDTFGKLVSKQLPKEIQDIIKTYPSAFRIGLQGPDPLFYHRPYASNDVKKKEVACIENLVPAFFKNNASC